MFKPFGGVRDPAAQPIFPGDVIVDGLEQQPLSKNMHQVRSRCLDIGSIVEHRMDLQKSQKLGLDNALNKNNKKS